MSINELRSIISALNEKKYVQHADSPEYANLILTDTEKEIIETYKPQQSLIIYGTLAPGKPNHHIVQPINGTWRQGTITGKLENEGWGAELGYYGFKPVESEDKIEIPADILFSNELAQYWPTLDEFEGDGYQRILAIFTLENDVIGIGNIYALNQKS